jgi:signal transduction histidine kinase
LFPVWRCWKLAVFLLLGTACALASTTISANIAAPKLQSIESAVQLAGSSGYAVPVVVRGIVILNGHQIVIADRTGATAVIPTLPANLALGDELEVTGKMTASPQPQIAQASLQRLWGGAMPLPMSISPDQAAEGENELFLVQTEARVVEVAPAGLTGVRLSLTGGHQNFSAVLSNDSGAGELADSALQVGAKLRLTGILFVNHGLSESRGDAFTLQLRSPEDIELVEEPSWWTRQHVLLLVGVSIIVILLGVLGYFRITHARFRAVAEERGNIARDIHDTLAQGFSGITLQLEAAEQTIERDPVQTKALLKEALQLVRHSRGESHLSIEILRSLSRSDSLDKLIARGILHMRQASTLTIEQRVTGAPAALSYNLVNNLFRIAQEAIANAAHHAGATTVVVQVSYAKKEVLLEVEDNGRGFDPASIPGPDDGHFGLTGMRERSAAINAFFEIHSTDGGTMIRVRTPL